MKVISIIIIVVGIIGLVSLIIGQSMKVAKVNEIKISCNFIHLIGYIAVVIFTLLYLVTAFSIL